MNDKMLRKYLAVVVILLFIGLAFAPSINANVSKESLVEFTTEICGLNGGKQTVKLTLEEAQEVEDLFDSIRERLNATESRGEAEEIFKEAVVELDKYGLLGGLSIKQAQRLVTGGQPNSRFMKILEKMSDIYKSIFDNYNNVFCSIAGKSDDSLFMSLTAVIRILTALMVLSPIYIFIPFVIPFLVLLLEKLGIKWDELWAMLGFTIALWWPLNIGGVVGFGHSYVDWGWKGYTPAKGWIKTFGLLGVKEWEGSFYGQLPKSLAFPNIVGGIHYPGAVGFIGIKIAQDWFLSCFYW